LISELHSWSSFEEVFLVERGRKKKTKRRKDYAKIKKIKKKMLSDTTKHTMVVNHTISQN